MSLECEYSAKSGEFLSFFSFNRQLNPLIPVLPFPGGGREGGHHHFLRREGGVAGEKLSIYIQREFILNIPKIPQH